MHNVYATFAFQRNASVLSFVVWNKRVRIRYRSRECAFTAATKFWLITRITKEEVLLVN